MGAKMDPKDRDRALARERMRQRRKGGLSRADRAENIARRVLRERHRGEFERLRRLAYYSLEDE